MAQNFNTYYTTGEFAKLCHTTKETLFHYDEIGILKPAIVKDNGYRYYLSSQYFEYDLIYVLQHASMSLKEIKDFMNKRNNESFIALLEDKYNALEKEKQHIQQMQQRLKNSISMIHYGMDNPQGIPYIEQCPKEHLLTVKLPDKTLSDKEMMDFISEHLDYCARHNLSEEIPIGTIIYQDNIQNNNIIENEYYVLLNKKVKDAHYKEKPAGQYATILHKGYYDTLSSSSKILLDYIKKHHYSISGDAYVLEIHNYFTSKNEQDYLISISIPIS